MNLIIFHNYIWLNTYIAEPEYCAVTEASWTHRAQELHELHDTSASLYGPWTLLPPQTGQSTVRLGSTGMAAGKHWNGSLLTK